MDLENTVPIITIYDNLLVPLRGDLDDAAAESLTGRLLQRVRDDGAMGVIIDVSGVWMMDSHLCAVLARLAAALRLMGADTVLSGLSPEIVTTLLEMGVDLPNTTTALTLESALEHFGISKASVSSRTPQAVAANGEPDPSLDKGQADA